MSDEAAKFLAELREFRSQNDQLLGAVRTEFKAGFRMMDAGFRRMNGQLAVLLEMAEALERQVTDMSDRYSRRRTLD